MKESYPGINPSIEEWKGQEITDFQEDLRMRVNATISEKWFYTHVKSAHPRIPRIDMLNILSKYSGYANWDDFVYRNGTSAVIAAGDVQTEATPVRSRISPNRFFIFVPVIVVAVMALFFGLFTILNTREYEFTFTDADTGEQIASPQTEVILLTEGETPVHNLVGTDGRFRLKTSLSRIRMIVKTPYYQVDTIVRMVKKLNTKETITLKADDYALMIHYFSNTRVDDWEKRRQRLEAMIDDNAMISQLMQTKGGRGLVLYSKEEFIDLMTVPSGSLKNIEVLGSRHKDGRIIQLRFRISDKKQ